MEIKNQDVANGMLGMIESIELQSRKKKYFLRSEDDDLMFRCRRSLALGEAIPKSIWEKLCALYNRANPCGG